MHSKKGKLLKLNQWNTRSKRSLRVSIIHVYEIPVRLDLKYWKSWWQSDHRLQESNQEVERSLHPSFPQFLSNNLLKCFVWQRNWLYRHSDLKGPWKKSNCSITYRITRHGRTIFLPLMIMETFEESAKRWHLWQYWAKRGAARCPGEMLTLQLAPEAVNESGCKAEFEVGIGLCSQTPTITKLHGSVLAPILGAPSFDFVI